MAVRGSERLMESRLGQPVPLSKTALAKLIASVEREGVKVVDWTIYGIPAPEGIKGTVQVPYKEAGRFVQGLMGSSGLRLRVTDMFPYGIIDPEGVQITFEGRSGFGR